MAMFVVMHKNSYLKYEYIKNRYNSIQNKMIRSNMRDRRLVLNSNGLKNEQLILYFKSFVYFIHSFNGRVNDNNY